FAAARGSPSNAGATDTTWTPHSAARRASSSSPLAATIDRWPSRSIARASQRVCRSPPRHPRCVFRWRMTSLRELASSGTGLSATGRCALHMLALIHPRVLQEAVERCHCGVDDAGPAVEQASTQNEPHEELPWDAQHVPAAEASAACRLLARDGIRVSVHLRKVLAQRVPLQVEHRPVKPFRASRHGEVLVNQVPGEARQLTPHQAQHPVPLRATMTKRAAEVSELP